MKYFKYHAIGNDYIVINSEDVHTTLTSEQIKKICHRNFGIGSDGILFGPLKSDKGQFLLRIFNPDGSEAEKSGNGLRIFSRYLWDMELVKEEAFSIETLGGLVNSAVLDNGKTVSVEMGKVSFWSDEIPVTGERREVISENITVENKTFKFCAATIGNPHCVIPLTEITPELAKQYGYLIETHKFFPNRINVQFMKVLDRENIQLEIWERGAGYTLASGSSSSAAAAVARRLNLCDSSVTVHMPGGMILIEIGENYSIQMTGSVTKVAEGIISPEIFNTNVT
ncbi:MAG: diaminopimelate epimerase [Richelia sp. RM2_1_2]|nr:diaminopimelate epimerase [Richelia sp. SM1_7_0]NJN09149.1 diaminopimelate epimerase [Richelia sp. RM1_1_1]NJO28691.1 diaminopimelate epimerase [Richelia sp. SL_2_1]NJO60718.1 diaminopimelate epimerase [Richelia sp. RM2_1_2]